MSEKVILLVEDNPKDEALIRRALERNGVANRIDIARDGAEALDYLLGAGGEAPLRRELPTVVLLDLKLPKIDGHEVLRRIRAEPRTRVLPVVILTSSDEECDIVKSYAGGANSYVRKPIAFEEFREAVRRLGLYWLLTNTPPPAPGGSP